MSFSPIIHCFPNNPLLHPSQVKPSHPGLEILHEVCCGATAAIAAILSTLK